MVKRYTQRIEHHTLYKPDSKKKHAVFVFGQRGNIILAFPSKIRRLDCMSPL